MTKKSFAIIICLIAFITSITIFSCKKDTPVSTVKPAPVLTTKACTINGSILYSGGDIPFVAGDSIYQKGICWSTNPNPTAYDNTTNDGTGYGSFVSVATNLVPNTTYYIRAYAMNAFDVGYGNQQTITTGQANIPSLTTLIVSNMTNTSLKSGITLINDGGCVITDWGLCYSKTPHPTLGSSSLGVVHITGGNTTFSNTVLPDSLTGLEANTTYYLRGYASNCKGIGYGNEITFTTKPTSIPVLTTTPITNISLEKALSGGTILSDGGVGISDRGVVYGTSPHPTINDFRTYDAGSGTLTNFTSNLGGMEGNTTYYVRAFAINNGGIGYGNEISFKTSVFAPGLAYKGGYIFYVEPSGNNGLMCAATDLQARPYGCGLPMNTSTAIGTGLANTNAVMSTCTNMNSYTSAAAECKNASINGFTDWYLPSRDELSLMYSNLRANNIGNFACEHYWSSSQYNNDLIWAVFFCGGAQFYDYSYKTYYVRPVRRF